MATLANALRYKHIYRSKPRQTKIQTLQIEAIGLQEKLSGLLSPFAGDVEAIYRDPNLNDTGKNNRCNDVLRTKVIPAIDSVLGECRAVVGKTRQLWDSLEKKLDGLKIDPQDVSAALVRREIREFLLQKPQHERTMIFHKQIQAGNFRLLQALKEQGLNDVYGILSPDEIKNAETLYVVNSDPVNCLLYFDTTKACVHLQMAMNGLQQQLGPHIKGLDLSIGVENLPDLLLPGMNAEKTEAALVEAAETKLQAGGN